jgi:hypothetical protein
MGRPRKITASPEAVSSSQGITMSDLIHVRLKHPHGLIFDLSNDRKVALQGSDFHLQGWKKAF